MEEILASIRKIISEEETPAAPAAKAEPEPVSALDLEDEAEFDDLPDAPPEKPVATLDLDDLLGDDDGEVLELTDVMEELPPEPVQADEPVKMPETLLSETAAQITAESFNHLSGLMVRDYPGSERTLEGVVREMLRPMLKDWLDRNLPEMVEGMVAREIARISGRQK